MKLQAGRDTYSTHVFFVNIVKLFDNNPPVAFPGMEIYCLRKSVCILLVYLFVNSFSNGFV